MKDADFYIRGREVKTSSTEKGIFLERAKHKNSAWILRGGLDGGKIMVERKQLEDYNT